MRIGIDARFYGPEKQKGLGRYVQELVRGLEKINADCEFIIFLRKDNWNEYQPSNSRFKKVLADYRWYTFAEQVFFPFLIWKEKIDLMHFPHFNVPVFCPVDFVVTIHDLLLNHFPTRRASTLGPVLYWFKNKSYCFTIKRAVERARKIIAVSEYTKKDILNTFKVGAGKIEVVYEGVFMYPLSLRGAIRPLAESDAAISREEFRQRAERRPARNSSILKKYKIIKPYLLYVGNAYPHKNLERLVEAFKKLKGLQMVLVGQLDYFYCRLGRPENIIFTDFISDSDLSRLYQNASLYVFPSLYEGFGLPPLEAMARGLPVVCSRASCLPEILGDSAIYFNPEDISDIVDKIKLVLYNQEIRKKLISVGYEQVKKYSWREMAEKIFEIYGRKK